MQAAKCHWGGVLDGGNGGSGGGGGGGVRMRKHGICNQRLICREICIHSNLSYGNREILFNVISLGVTRFEIEGTSY